MTKLHSPVLFSISLAALLGISGCSEPSNEVEVSGEVTVEGEPISKGTISFVATDGEASTGGGVIKDGQYTALVEPGPKKVMVLGNKLVGQEPLYADMPDSPMRDKYEMVTHEAYNAAHLTPLTANIEGPQQNLNFDLDKDVSSRR